MEGLSKLPSLVLRRVLPYHSHVFFSLHGQRLVTVGRGIVRYPNIRHFSVEKSFSSSSNDDSDVDDNYEDDGDNFDEIFDELDDQLSDEYLDDEQEDNGYDSYMLDEESMGDETRTRYNSANYDAEDDVKYASVKNEKTGIEKPFKETRGQEPKRSRYENIILSSLETVAATDSKRLEDELYMKELVHTLMMKLCARHLSWIRTLISQLVDDIAKGAPSHITAKTAAPREYQFFNPGMRESVKRENIADEHLLVYSALVSNRERHLQSYQESKTLPVYHLSEFIPDRSFIDPSANSYKLKKKKK